MRGRHVDRATAGFQKQAQVLGQRPRLREGSFHGVDLALLAGKGRVQFFQQPLLKKQAFLQPGDPFFQIFVRNTHGYAPSRPCARASIASKCSLLTG